MEKYQGLREELVRAWQVKATELHVGTRGSDTQPEEMVPVATQRNIGDLSPEEFEEQQR